MSKGAGRIIKTNGYIYFERKLQQKGDIAQCTCSICNIPSAYPLILLWILIGFMYICAYIYFMYVLAIYMVIFEAKHTFMCIHLYAQSRLYVIRSSVVGQHHWMLGESRGHNQEVWFTDYFLHKNWSLNQGHSGRYVEEEACSVETERVRYSMYTQNTCINYCHSSKDTHFNIIQGSLSPHERLKSSYQHLAVIADIWLCLLGEMDGETNTGFHHCHYNALRELSEHDKGY